MSQVYLDLVRTNRMMDENVQAAYYDVPGTKDENGDWKDFEVNYEVRNYADDNTILAKQVMTYNASNANWKNNRLHFENIPVKYSSVTLWPDDGATNGQLTYGLYVADYDSSKTSLLTYPNPSSQTSNPIFTVENLKVHGPEDTSTPTYNITVTNHKKSSIDIPVEKRWVDNGQKRPESIRVDLKANGKVVDYKTLTKEGDWKTTFTNLPVKDETGKDITYTIEEALVTGYATRITGDVTNGFVITNTGEVPPTTETTTSQTTTTTTIVPPTTEEKTTTTIVPPTTEEKTTTTEVPPTTEEKTTTTEVPPTTEEKTTTTIVPSTTEERTITSSEVPTTGEVPPTTQTPPNKELPPTGTTSMMIPVVAAITFLLGAFGIVISVKVKQL